MHLLRQPFWHVGFRPFFTFGCIAGLSLPLAWALVMVGAVPPAPTLAVPGLVWHAHEMFFGFGLAVLGGFLLTASKNWVGIRGYHDGALAALAAAWLADRALVNLGAGLPLPLVMGGGAIFTAALVAMLLATLIRHRRVDVFRDNVYFILALPLLLPAKVLLLSEGHFADGVGMSLAVFRLAFLIMLERTYSQFLRGGLRIEVPRIAALDHGIKSLALVSAAAPWLPGPAQAGLSLLLGVLVLVRWALWSPRPAMSRIDIGIMAFGHLMLAAQLLADGLGAPSNLAIHLFTVGTMGTIVPAMIVRISKGHTGRKVVFEPADVFVLRLLVAGLVLRVAMPALWPAGYAVWIVGAALTWLLGFGLLAWRYVPWLFQARVDGREH